jgi:hypothetical protein
MKKERFLLIVLLSVQFYFHMNEIVYFFTLLNMKSALDNLNT